MKGFINKHISKIKKIGILILWLIIWQGVYLIVGKDVLLPSPFSTFKTLIHLLLTKQVYWDMAYTFYRVCLAVGVSFVSGVVGAIWSSKSSFIKAFLQPFITLLKTTPVMAVVMLALLWLNSSTMPILVGFLMCFPIVYTNLLVGIENRDETVFEMAKVYRVKRKVFIFKLYIPSLLPSIYSALSLSFGLAWKAVIAAEVLAAPKYGMGYHLLTSKIYLETDRLFSWVILIVVFSTVLERLLRKRSRYFDKN